MRVDAIGSDLSRATAVQATQSAPARPPRAASPAQASQKPAAPAKDTDGDSDGDVGTKGGILDIGA